MNPLHRAGRTDAVAAAAPGKSSMLTRMGARPSPGALCGRYDAQPSAIR